MKHKLENIIKKYNAITDQLADATVISNPNQLRDLAKEYSQIESIVKIGKEYINILDQIDDNESILKEDDTDLKEIATDELIELERKKAKLEKKIIAPEETDTPQEIIDDDDSYQEDQDHRIGTHLTRYVEGVRRDICYGTKINIEHVAHSNIYTLSYFFLR